MEGDKVNITKLGHWELIMFMHWWGSWSLYEVPGCEVEEGENGDNDNTGRRGGPVNLDHGEDAGHVSLPNRDQKHSAKEMVLK